MSFTLLRDLGFKTSYRSDRDDIARDFLSKALRAADYYDRATGYFTSSVLSHVAAGLHSFAGRNGLMRLVASPFLAADDVEAIRLGYSSRDSAAMSALEATVNDLENTAESYSTRILTWLIANKRLIIKIAIPKASHGIFHEKIGIVRDSNDALAFTGSANETGAGVEDNFESIDVFTSWDDPKRVADKVADFEALWRNTTGKLSVIDFPEALAARLIKLAPPSPPTAPPPMADKRPAITLRVYQDEAINAWRSNNYRGVLSMATGTGKTKTALGAIRECTASGLQAIVVLAPLKHLIEQWDHEIRQYFPYDPIKCFSDNDWEPQVAMALRQHRLGLRTPPIVLVATYASAQSAQFVSAAHSLPHPTLLIADEVHNITLASSEIVCDERYNLRLGLSATPERYDDPAGTEALLTYFGGIVFEYSIRDAIRAGNLVPYDYHPIFCEFTEAETVEYNFLKASLQEARQEAKDNARARRLQAILRLRARLIQRASDKIQKFERLIDDGNFADIGYNLVYTHPEFLSIIQDFLGHDRHFRVHTFTARETLTERRDILDRFARKKLDFLTAIRCLDEGVDVPPTRTAFLLNSSANPKEFIQRRGRVLRPWPGKSSAHIYDFVVLPTRVDDADAAYVQRELDRFYEFASIAQNRNTAMRLLEERAEIIGLHLNRSL